MEREPAFSVVFDTMVYLQALASNRGTAYALLQRAYAGEFSLVVSRDVLEEVCNVLSRPAVRRKNPRITDEARDTLIRSLQEQSVMLDEVPRRFTYERDPDDEPVVNLAIAASARYLVTWDRDLLDFMDENRPEGPAFQGAYPNLRIINPTEFLQELSGEG